MESLVGATEEPRVGEAFVASPTSPYADATVEDVSGDESDEALLSKTTESTLRERKTSAPPSAPRRFTKFISKVDLFPK